MTEERWLSVDEVMKYLGVKRLTVYRWISGRGLPAHKRGKLWLFSKAEVDAWVRQGGNVATGDECVTRTTAASHDDAVPVSASDGPRLVTGFPVDVQFRQGLLEDSTLPDARPSRSAEQTRFVPSPTQAAEIPVAARTHVGVALGLGTGVDMPLRIEALAPPGVGKLVPTGAVMRAMSASVEAALAYISEHLPGLGIDRARMAESDMILIADVGDIPDQSDSLSAAVALSMFSAIAGIPLTRATAIAGKVGVDGALLPVSDIRQRLRAASRGGVREALVPAENAAELKGLPVQRDWPLKVVSVGHFDEVIRLASALPQLGLFGLVGKQAY